MVQVFFFLLACYQSQDYAVMARDRSSGLMVASLPAPEPDLPTFSEWSTRSSRMRTRNKGVQMGNESLRPAP